MLWFGFHFLRIKQKFYLKNIKAKARNIEVREGILHLPHMKAAPCIPPVDEGISTNEIGQTICHAHRNRITRNRVGVRHRASDRLHWNEARKSYRISYISDILK